MKEEQLIFIVSQPRSGSTYLQNLLSNNDQVNTCSESWILLNLASFIKPKLIQSSFNQRFATLAFEEYLSKYPDLDFKEKLRSFVFDLYAPLAKDYDYIIDKAPRYWEIIDELLKWFPKSRVIVLKRNPVDVLTSIIKTWGYNTPEKLFWHKRDIMLAPMVIHKFSKKREQDDRVYTIKYEDLLKNKETEAKRLYQWLGISFSNDILDTRGNTKYKGTFGDPYQNAIDGDKIRKESQNKELPQDLKDFITGYKHYLTPRFMEDYGGYTSDIGKPTAIFRTFVEYEECTKAIDENEMSDLGLNMTKKSSSSRFLWLKGLLKSNGND